MHLTHYIIPLVTAFALTPSHAFLNIPQTSIHKSSFSLTTNLIQRDLSRHANIPSIETFSENPTSSDTPNRRAFLSSIASLTTLSIATLTSNPKASYATDIPQKVLVLGGTGFVGSEVCRKLQSLGIEVISTSRDGRDGTIALDFLTPGINVAKEVEKIASGCTAVISTVGSIGTSNDGTVNAASGLAAIGAKAADVKRFVYIGVSPEVKESVKGLSFLEDYMTGKESAETFIKKNFSDDGLSYCLIDPTFIYGGNKFGLNPPRVASGYGKIVEGLLSTGVFRAAANVSPGLIGVAFEPPVSVEDVAGAAVAGAIGSSGLVLDTHDKIVEAAKTLNALVK